MGSSTSTTTGSESAAAESAVAKVVALRAAKRGHGEGEATSGAPAAAESKAAMALDSVEAPAATSTAKATPTENSAPAVESVEVPNATAILEAPATTENTALRENAVNGAETPADQVQCRCQEQCAKPDASTAVAAQDSKAAAAATAVSEAAVESQEAASTTDTKSPAPGAQSMRADATEFVPTSGASGGEPGEQNPDYAMWAEWAANLAAAHAAAAGPWAAPWCAATNPAEAMSLWPAAAGGLEGGRGLEHDSPRTMLLKLCGDWGALAATGPDKDESVTQSITREDLLQLRRPPTDGLPQPEELATLRCAARE